MTPTDADPRAAVESRSESRAATAAPPTRDSLAAAVAHWAAARPDAIALAHPGGSVSWRQLHRQALQVAAGLRTAGIAAGDVVAVQLPNTVPFVVTLLAAGLLGATVQMLHMPYRQAELASLLGHGRARAFVGLDRFKDEAPVATVAALGGPAVLVEVPSAPDRAPPAALRGAVSWADLLASGDGVAAADFPLPDPATRYVLLYTSGTTAEPKGVPVAHRQFIGNAAAALEPLRVTGADVLLPAAPCTHLYGLFVLEMGLLAGACVSLLPAFTPAALVETIRRDQVTTVFAGPAHFKPLLDEAHPPTDAFAGVRMVCLSGTTVARELAEAVEGLMSAGGGKAIQLWGMSELQAGAYGRPDDPPEIRHGTAGRAAPGTELRIQGEGRLQVRGPSLFEGYLDNPAATAQAFQDGWFDTGDTGYLTDDGALVLTGRTREIINRGGVKFNPLDVEAVIDRMPGVARSAVVPMPDPVLGERACLFVQPAPAADAPVLTLERVTAELAKAGIARFKWPERLETVAEMPLTPTQKVMRGRLAARIVPRAGQD